MAENVSVGGRSSVLTASDGAGNLYVVGGRRVPETFPFTAFNLYDAWKFDSVSGVWTALPGTGMGATAAVLDSTQYKLYFVGNGLFLWRDANVQSNPRVAKYLQFGQPGWVDVDLTDGPPNTGTRAMGASWTGTELQFYGSAGWPHGFAWMRDINKWRALTQPISDVTTLDGGSIVASADNSYLVGTGGVSSTLGRHYSLCNSPNLIPAIASEPMLIGFVSTPYVYQVVASDPDGRALVYSLTTNPTGMEINVTTGQVSWFPGAGQIGSHPVVISVRDPSYGIATQAFTVVVNAQNQLPTFNSTPVSTATAGIAYSYDADATDPEGQAIGFTLPVAPAGMTIAASTGLVSWTPAANQVGAQNVTVRATDASGGVGDQAFVVTVAPNLAPTFSSTPATAATVGQPYSYDADAVDPEGQAVSFSLPVAPVGMTIVAQTGVVSWTPAANQTGARSVTVLATDAFGVEGNQAFSINVAIPAANTQTAASSSGTSNYGAPFSVSVTVTAPAGGGVPTGSVAVNGTAPFAADSCIATLAASGANSATGSCSITPALPGVRTLVASYAAQPGFNGSVSGSIIHAVRGTSQLRIVDRPPLPFGVGQLARIRIDLATLPASPTAATGSVNISAPGSAGCVITLPQSECLLPIGQAGSYAVTASYAGDAVYSAGSATVPVTTAPASVRVFPINGRRVIDVAGTTTYQIWVVNTGAAVSGVLDVPNAAGLTDWIGWNCVASNGATCAASGSAPVSIPVTLPPNSSLIVTVSAVVANPDVASISVLATLNTTPSIPGANRSAVIADGVDTDPVGFLGDGFEDSFDE